MGYYDNYLVDNPSCVIVGVQATAARMSQETVAAKEMIARFAEWQGCDPESVGADTTYGNGEFLQWLMERDITPYMHTRENGPRKKSLLYGPERFTYLPESNSYLCPAGQQLNYSTMADTTLGTVPTSTSEPANVVVGARKRHNAPAHH
jgi:hypothetical protein